MGFRHGEDLVRHVAACDAFIFPSRTDTFGLVLLEAMACGLPVAAYPVTGPIDVVVNGVTGFLDQDLRSAALRCLALDPAACRAHALQFSWEACTRQFRSALVAAPPHTSGAGAGVASGLKACVRGTSITDAPDVTRTHGQDRLVSRSLATLRDVRSRAVEFEAAHADAIVRVAEPYRNSARNLLHYLSVRQRDIRTLQADLQSLGLSSLGILEQHVLASINAVVENLEILAGQPMAGVSAPPADFLTGPLLLRDHTHRLFGAAPAARAVRIMVTTPSEAATDPVLVEELVRAGMDVMRINCAHDDPVAWRAMADNLRRAERIVGRRCRIQADLAGPKLRTGTIEPAGRVLRVRPRLDALGRLVTPARVWFTPEVEPEPSPDSAVAVPLASMTGAWRGAARVDCARRARTSQDVPRRQRRRSFVARGG